jgi:hypothetical protein
MTVSKAPIPMGTLGLRAAFELVCERRVPDWREILAEKETCLSAMASRNVGAARVTRLDALDVLETADCQFSPEQMAVIKIGQRLERTAEREDAAKKHADRILREALADGAIVAMILNPADGEHYPVGSAERWLIPSGLEYEPGFRTDHVADYCNAEGVMKPGPLPEQPGPPTCFDDGLPRRVFFDRERFAAWAGAVTSAKRGPKDKWDWTRGRAYAWGEMEKRGDFADFQNQTEKWKSQADLVVLVQAYLDEIGDNGEPGDTITKEKVRAWVDEYRARGSR